MVSKNKHNILGESLKIKKLKKIKIKKFSRLLVCLNMQIWCYMVNLPFYWDTGFSGKLKSKIRKATILPVLGNLAL